jgi:hypothetical protein
MQLDLSREDFRAQKSKWQMKHAEVEKQRNQLQGKDTGYMAQLRKKEMEVKKMQDQLQKVLAGGKGAGKKGGLSLVVALPRGSSGGRQRLSEAEEFLQRAGDAYTEQLGELRAENASLRQLLHTLCTELDALHGEALNGSPSSQPPPPQVGGAGGGPDADESMASAAREEEEALEEEEEALSPQMRLPAQYMEDGVQQAVQAQLQQLRELLLLCGAGAAADDDAAAVGGSAPMESPSLAKHRATELEVSSSLPPPLPPLPRLASHHAHAAEGALCLSIAGSWYLVYEVDAPPDMPVPSWGGARLRAAVCPFRPCGHRCAAAAAPGASEQPRARGGRAAGRAGPEDGAAGRCAAHECPAA